MINAKKELLKVLEVNNKNVNNILYAKLSEDPCYKDEPNYKEIILKENYTEEELTLFLNKIDVEYPNGYGMQVMFGFVVFTDGTWLERAEYDGAEWWKYLKIPEL